MDSLHAIAAKVLSGDLTVSAAARQILADSGDGKALAAAFKKLHTAAKELVHYEQQLGGELSDHWRQSFTYEYNQAEKALRKITAEIVKKNAL